MTRILLRSFAFPVLLVAATTSTPSGHAAGDFAKVNQIVRGIMNGERALDHATALDDWWRWPGTPGFDKAIDLIEKDLRAANYVLESEATANDRLVYRIEEYQERVAWEPIDATITIVGEDTPLLAFQTNRNMIAIGSGSTPDGGVELEVVDIGSPGRRDWPDIDLSGKLVLGRMSISSLYRQAVVVGGASGVLGYSIPAYNRPQQNRDSISFTSIGQRRLDDERDSPIGFAINLSTRALERIEDALRRGPVRLHVDIKTRTRMAPERVIIAEVRGSSMPDQRIMLSAHVQEPGANDNASGVAAQIEIARALATLVTSNQIDPMRTITMLWGDEISAPNRYLQQDDNRRAGVRFGISLDMVGADPAKTGGVFLVEKIPDPSAIWTRGNDKHTEWGGRRMSEADMMPHFFNDFVFNRLADQAKATGWDFASNPYEGGSDHVPFLRADIPAVLLWHFTDVFYHTDGDRASNLSATTLANSATAAASCAIVLAQPTEDRTKAIIAETLVAGLARLDEEAALSAAGIEAGDDLVEQLMIVRSWLAWYRDALATCTEVAIEQSSKTVDASIAAAQQSLDDRGNTLLQHLEELGQSRVLVDD